VVWATIRSSTAAVSGSAAFRKRMRQAARRFFDEGEEDVEAGCEARGAGLDLYSGHRAFESLEQLAGVAFEEVRIQLLLGGEVLVDERLGDADLARDVVDRGQVVAAPREHGERRLDDDGAAIFGGESLADRGHQGITATACVSDTAWTD
jgi:hypothetical protein